jgi:hypothetical protein
MSDVIARPNDELATAGSVIAVQLRRSRQNDTDETAPVTTRTGDLARSATEPDAYRVGDLDRLSSPRRRRPVCRTVSEKEAPAHGMHGSYTASARCFARRQTGCT